MGASRKKSRRRFAQRSHSARRNRRDSLIGSPYARRLRVEELEDRRMLAAFDVTSLADAGAGSLREALTTANGNGEADTITFSVAGSIRLGSQLPTITDAVTIIGGQQITLDAGNGDDDVFGTGDGYRLFNIDDGDDGSQIDVTLRGLTFTGGDPMGDGGAIRSRENLALADSVVSGNSTGDGSDGGTGAAGGAIWAGSDLTINDSTITENSTGSGGSGVNRDA